MCIRLALRFMCILPPVIVASSISLGVATIASRIFDALIHKQRGVIQKISKAVDPNVEPDKFLLRLRQELRLAALLHDTGHSLFSHTSERVYEELDLLVKASKELTAFVGKKKGAGEVISFCLALTPAVRKLLDRAGNHLIGSEAFEDYSGPIDLRNVALIIVGRSSHPHLQFLGDIVSSGFDADKLDYLLRDATAAGLPLRYDIDRYLYDVRMEKETLSDGEGLLKKLYSSFQGAVISRKRSAPPQYVYDYYDTYRLKLSKRAMNVIEQIVICKMMLYSYIYHHTKVRASEGTLMRLLKRKLGAWRLRGVEDSESMIRFFEMTDASLGQLGADETSDAIDKEYSYRLVNCLLPREVYSISGPSALRKNDHYVKDFLLNLRDRDVGKRIVGEKIITDLEQRIGKELVKLRPKLWGTAADALAQAGVWVDAPTPPKFEDINTLIGGASTKQSGVSIAQVFPIREWTSAYEAYRYQVRIFAFSEYWDLTKDAAKAAMKHILKISEDKFYDSIRRDRN